MSPIEIIAALFGFVCVWLTGRQHIACWPTGLVQVALYIVVFYEARLYSDMLLHVCYVFLQFYGWYAWLHGGPGRTALAVSRLLPSNAVLFAALAAAGTLALGTAMRRYTDASLPFPDAFVAVASLIAQYLMSRKVLESWLVWIVVDVVSIGLFLAKALYPTTVLYSLFLVLAVWGWLEWRRTCTSPATA